MVDLHLFEWRGHGRRLTADTLQAAGGILPFPAARVLSGSRLAIRKAMVLRAGTRSFCVLQACATLRISANVTDHFRNNVTGADGTAKADKSYTNRSRTGAEARCCRFRNHADSCFLSDSPLSFNL